MGFAIKTRENGFIVRQDFTTGNRQDLEKRGLLFGAYMAILDNKGNHNRRLDPTELENDRYNSAPFFRFADRADIIEGRRPYAMGLSALGINPHNFDPSRLTERQRAFLLRINEGFQAFSRSD